MAPVDITTSEVGKPTEVEVEDVKPASPEHVVAHYAPVNEIEEALDKRINWKLDLTVLLVLAISFIVSAANSILSQSSHSTQALTCPRSALWHRQNKRGLCGDQQLR